MSPIYIAIIIALLLLVIIFSVEDPHRFNIGYIIIALSFGISLINLDNGRKSNTLLS